MSQILSDSEKAQLATKIKEFLAEECDMDVSEISDETDIMEDLKADSLVFLELIQEIQQDYKLGIELRQIGKYIVKHPVKTVGEAISTLYNFIERGDELLKQLEAEEAAAKAADASQS